MKLLPLLDILLRYYFLLIFVAASLEGKKKFEMTFDQPVSAILPCDGNRKYYFIRDYSVQEIHTLEIKVSSKFTIPVCRLISF